MQALALRYASRFNLLHQLPLRNFYAPGPPGAPRLHPHPRQTAARAFYEHTLGLTFVKDDDFALVFSVGPNHQMLRIAHTPQFTPFPFTIFGWQVADIHTTVDELSARGVSFLRFSFFQQDPDGVWSAPDGAQVAWFHDPDGNTLSVSYHPS